MQIPSLCELECFCRPLLGTITLCRTKGNSVRAKGSARRQEKRPAAPSKDDNEGATELGPSYSCHSFCTHYAQRPKSRVYLVRLLRETRKIDVSSSMFMGKNSHREGIYARFRPRCGYRLPTSALRSPNFRSRWARSCALCGSTLQAGIGPSSRRKGGRVTDRVRTSFRDFENASPLNEVFPENFDVRDGDAGSHSCLEGIGVRISRT